MAKYTFTTALLIIVGGFIGCGIGALLAAPSAGTGFGCLAGGILAVGYYLTTKDNTPAA